MFYVASEDKYHIRCKPYWWIPHILWHAQFPAYGKRFFKPWALKPQNSKPSNQKKTENQKSKWLRFLPMFSFILWWGVRMFSSAPSSLREKTTMASHVKKSTATSAPGTHGGWVNWSVLKVVPLDGNWETTKECSKKERKRAVVFVHREEEQKETPMDSMYRQRVLRMTSSSLSLFDAAHSNLCLVVDTPTPKISMPCLCTISL